MIDIQTPRFVRYIAGVPQDPLDERAKPLFSLLCMRFAEYDPQSPFLVRHQ